MATASRRRRQGWRGWLSGLVATDLPGAVGAGTSVIAALTLWGWRSSEQLLPGAFGRSWWLVVPDLAVAVGVSVLGGTIVVLLGRLRKWRLPWLSVCALVFAAVLLFTMGAGPSLIGWVAVVVVTLAVAAVGGWFLGAALGHTPPRYPALRWSGVGVVSVAALVLVGYLLWSGPGADAPAAITTATTIGDPAVPGSYRVMSTAYGSGSDHANPAYGPGVAIRTAPVDGSAVIGGWRQDSTRSRVWGFTAATLPLNALVWAPVGPGPFPLVLILHGNTAFDDSEAGFAYLGNRLASRGYLVASLDEGFLNTGLLDKSNPISGAANARAWLVLAHLHQWKTWNEHAGNPFTGKVDLAT